VQALVEQGVVEKESGVALDPSQADVFLCGNPDMVKAVQLMLEAKGFKTDEPGKPGTIHVEEYW
jgi:ferredoxin--NADP+ reductase